MSRENMLSRIRTALKRTTGQSIGECPAARVQYQHVEESERVSQFASAISKLAGHVHLAQSTDDVRAYVSGVLDGRPAIASNSDFLAGCGIDGIVGVTTGVKDKSELREHCASSYAGITSADYALADTGTLVMLSTPQEARMISLLPPVHIAVIPRERILVTLDELFAVLPRPADITSAMVLITGPSRTADIEQILVRGVHGPGEIHVVIL